MSLEVMISESTRHALTRQRKKVTLGAMPFSSVSLCANLSNTFKTDVPQKLID